MMETNSSKKLKQQQQLDDDDDAVSSYIPECIMSHILSFLPTEDSTRASFVSKTWKSLSSPLSVIDLDFERFSSANTCCLNDQKKRFAQFVQCIMLLHKGRHLEQLRLVLDISGFKQDDDHPQIDEWVSFAMTSDSTTLDLDFWGGREGERYPFRDDDYYCLPKCIMPLQSVEVLRLKYCIFKPWHATLFMSIKVFVLTAVSLPGDSVVDLFVGCPYLEELHLIACIVPEDFIIENPITELKCLVFDSCKGKGGSIIYSFLIDIPSLLRFKYVGAMKSVFHIGDSRNLTEAEIKFDDLYCDSTATDDEAAEDDATIYSAMLREVLSNMDNLESLTISKSCLQVLTLDHDNTFDELLEGHESHERLSPPLPKLKYLSLEAFEGFDYTTNLACLLKSSPNLETLCIDQSMDELVDPDLTSAHFDQVDWRWYLIPPESLRNLKKVEIKGFEGRKEEMRLLKVILDHSLVLEEMVICKAAMKSRYASMKRNGNQKKTLKLLKASQQAAIEMLLTYRRGSCRARILLL